MQLTGHDNNMQAWTNASYGGGWVTFFVGLGLQNWLAIIGTLVVVATFAVNTWKQVRADRREQELHDLKRKRLAQNLSDVADEV